MLSQHMPHKMPEDPSLPVDRRLHPTPLLMQSLRASLQLCQPLGHSNATLRSEAGSGPANSNSPSLGTPCCQLSLSDLSHNLHCSWGSPDRETPQFVPVLLVARPMEVGGHEEATPAPGIRKRTGPCPVPVCCILGSHLWMIPCLLWPALRRQEDIFLPPPDSDL